MSSYNEQEELVSNPAVRGAVFQNRRRMELTIVVLVVWLIALTVWLGYLSFEMFRTPRPGVVTTETDGDVTKVQFPSVVIEDGMLTPNQIVKLMVENPTSRFSFDFEGVNQKTQQEIILMEGRAVVKLPTSTKDKAQVIVQA